MKAETTHASKVCAPESWEQPPIGQMLFVTGGNQVYWLPQAGIESCSATVMTAYPGPVVDVESAAWDLASDEAFLNFERSLPD